MNTERNNCEDHGSYYDDKCPECHPTCFDCEKYRAALEFIADQHCPTNPETALGRTLKMCIEHAKEILK